MPIELTISTDGDIGIAEGVIVDNLIDARLSFHLPIFENLFDTRKTRKTRKTRLQFLATHNLHYNSARENTMQGVFRFAGQFTFQYPVGF